MSKMKEWIGKTVKWEAYDDVAYGRVIDVSESGDSVRVQRYLEDVATWENPSACSHWVGNSLISEWNPDIITYETPEGPTSQAFDARLYNESEARRYGGNDWIDLACRFELPALTLDGHCVEVHHECGDGTFFMCVDDRSQLGTQAYARSKLRPIPPPDEFAWQTPFTYARDKKGEIVMILGGGYNPNDVFCTTFMDGQRHCYDRRSLQPVTFEGLGIGIREEKADIAPDESVQVPNLLPESDSILPICMGMTFKPVDEFTQCSGCIDWEGKFIESQNDLGVAQHDRDIALKKVERCKQINKDHWRGYKKMEEDLGKVRKAIGDLKWKEIVGE